MGVKTTRKPQRIQISGDHEVWKELETNYLFLSGVQATQNKGVGRRMGSDSQVRTEQQMRRRWNFLKPLVKKNSKTETQPVQRSRKSSWQSSQAGWSTVAIASALVPLETTTHVSVCKSEHTVTIHTVISFLLQVLLFSVPGSLSKIIRISSPILAGM